MCILRGCPVQPPQNDCARRARAPKTSTPTTPKARSSSGRRRTTTPSRSFPHARISCVSPARASFSRTVFGPFCMYLNPAFEQRNPSFVLSPSGSLVFVAPSQLAHRRTRLSYFLHLVVLSTVSHVRLRPPTLSPRRSASALSLLSRSPRARLPDSLRDPRPLQTSRSASHQRDARPRAGRGVRLYRSVVARGRAQCGQLARGPLPSLALRSDERGG